MAPHDVRIVHRLPLGLRLDEKGIGREHFGFADGLSQPIPLRGRRGRLWRRHAGREGRLARRAARRGPDRPCQRPSRERAGAGGAGRPDDHVASDDRRRCRRRALPEGFLDFGLNGSYMVVRELHQHVAAFWDSMRRGCGPNPRARSRAFGRRHRRMARRARGRPQPRRRSALPGRRRARGRTSTASRRNDVRLLATTIRTASAARSARMSAAPIRATRSRPTPAREQTLLEAANNHRILRRGRKYGQDVVDPRVDDGDGSRAAVHLPQHRHRPPVRVRPADLAAQPELRHPVRRDRSAGRPRGAG